MSMVIPQILVAVNQLHRKQPLSDSNMKSDCVHSGAPIADASHQKYVGHPSSRPIPLMVLPAGDIWGYVLFGAIVMVGMVGGRYWAVGCLGLWKEGMGLWEVCDCEVFGAMVMLGPM